MNVSFKAVSEAQYNFVKFSNPGTLSEVLYYGGLGCGKSEALCVAATRWLSVPRSVVILASTTLVSLKRATVPLLRKYISDNFVKSGTFREGDLVLRNGSELHLSGTQEAEKLKSINAHAVFVDEVTHTKKEDYQTVMLRARVPHPYGNVCMSACNPASIRHWVHEEIVRKVDNRTIFALKGKSNENVHLGKGYIEKLMSLSPAKRKILLEGEWGTPENVVFYGFSESNVTETPSFIPYKFILFQDYGGGTGVAGLLGAWIDITGTKIYIVDEFTGERVTHHYMLSRMNVMRKHHAEQQKEGFVVYDAANAALGMQMRNDGWQTATCDKAIEEGIAVVNDQFVQRDILIHPRCKQLLGKLETVVRDDLGNLRKIKGWDLLDALRYGVVYYHRLGGINVSV